jgi:hypothetical protein
MPSPFHPKEDTMATLRYIAAAATALMALMNLPIAVDDGGAGIPTPLAWLISALGAVGLVAAVGLLVKAAWAVWAAVAVGVVNLVGAVIYLIGDGDGALIGLTVSAVGAAASIAYARTRTTRHPQPA